MKDGGNPLDENPTVRQLVSEAVSTAARIPIDYSAVPDEVWDPANLATKWNTAITISESFCSAFGVPSAVRRAELFDAAAKLGDRPTSGALREFFIHVNAWGYGPTGYGVFRTNAVRDGNPKLKARPEAWSDFDLHAGAALATLRSHGHAAAYYYLFNKKIGGVHGWGPAFFTKFLYFADPANQEGGSGGAQILDNVLDGWVRSLTGDPPVGAGIAKFKTWSWTTPEYAFYVALMNRIAKDKSAERADFVEATLFNARTRHGRHLAAARHNLTA